MVAISSLSQSSVIDNESMDEGGYRPFVIISRSPVPGTAEPRLIDDALR